jgi:cyanate permease
MAAAPLATTFASSLAWLILKLGESGPIAPWRLLFLLEGFPSVVIASIAWVVIPDSPGTASFLSNRERKVARLRLRHEKPRQKGSQSSPNLSSGLKPRDVLSVFADSKAWIMAIMFFLTNMAYSSLPVFLPTILKDMGHSAVESQALAAPPYLVSFVTVLITAHMSDRSQQRTPFIVAHALASAAGYTVLALARRLQLGNMLRYIAVYPATVGFFNVVVLIIAWSINNQPSESRQGGGFALLQIVGQCGPLVGTRLYPKSDAPFYEPGMWTCAGAMVGVVIMAFAVRWQLKRMNWKLDTTSHADATEETEGLVGSEVQQDREDTFRYML